MTLFVARQLRPAGFAFKVLRTYIVEATDAQHAESLAVEAFPRPPAEFAAAWQVRPLPGHVVEVDTESWLTHTEEGGTP